MKKIFGLLLLFSLFSQIATAQSGTKSILPSVDKSPMDESYFPVDYPLLKPRDKATEPMRARVIYSRPQMNDRKVFGKLIEYNKMWRLGANEGTEIEFFTEVKINNEKIKKGRYTLYAIPNPDKWTFILSKDTDVWGSYQYNEKNDLVRVDVPVQIAPEKAEYFSLYFLPDVNGCNLVASWDNVQAMLPISFSK